MNSPPVSTATGDNARRIGGPRVPSEKLGLYCPASIASIASERTVVREIKMTKAVRKKTAKPAGSKELAISKCVEDLGIDDEVLEIYGPTELADSVVWEVWVSDKGDELATRFVEECVDGKNNVFDTFQQLAVRLNVQHRATLEKAHKAEWDRQRQLADIQSKNALQSSEITSRLIELQARNAVQAAEISSRRIEQIVKLGMIAFGFATAMGIAVYLVLTGTSYIAFGAAGVIFSLIASACVWMYGRFELFRIPNPFSATTEA